MHSNTMSPGRQPWPTGRGLYLAVVGDVAPRGPIRTLAGGAACRLNPHDLVKRAH
jgi:hypothetical protein